MPKVLTVPASLRQSRVILRCLLPRVGYRGGELGPVLEVLREESLVKPPILLLAAVLKAG